ncbi:MAG: hypothetical protein ABT940_09100 [Alphaproteobacteria bacterium]
MSLNAQRSAAMAARSIAAVGTQLTLRQRVEAAYDPDAGGGTLTETDHAVTGLVVHRAVAPRENKPIETGDGKAILSAQGMTIVPRIADQLIDGNGALYQIVRVDVIAVTGQTVAYSLHLRV